MSGKPPLVKSIQSLRISHYILNIHLCVSDYYFSLLFINH